MRTHCPALPPRPYITNHDSNNMLFVITMQFGLYARSCHLTCHSRVVEVSLGFVFELDVCPLPQRGPTAFARRVVKHGSGKWVTQT
eukprot:9485969-Pyramimonas_sp.AAC.1